MKIKERLEEVRERVEKAAIAAGRNPEEIRILGATKGVDPERIEEAIEAGLHLFGENRVQEAERKIPQVRGEAEWHMIGHLQRNKVKKAVRLFSMIQSVDSFELAREIDKRVETPIEVLIEVNTSMEPQKHGVKPEETESLVERCLSLEKIKLRGLMTLGPYPPSEKNSRRAFALLRELRNRIQEKFAIELPILSMGMTEDFEWAVMEGATIIRIGRAIFGERN
ncbi:MAG: YggS family pyridoxal phosphate-dependent enzyme [Candidatus Hydrothermota bacterium]|nr:MAG: YggS family pyridoxal phosphate-dependent enzyme [Candidatus Hydrothermae bacterium]RKZ04901.1 MAG: YggS family pyridoxal phosphate-dependent enzyme [Candidatus Hydrothermae bacterium]